MTKTMLVFLSGLVLFFSFSKASEEWNEERVNSLVDQIQKKTVKIGETSPLIPSHLIPESFFENMKKRIVKLAMETKAKFDDLKWIGTSIVENWRRLEDHAVVTTDIDVENKTGSTKYYMKVDPILANELGIDENYEAYEVQYSWKKDKTN